MRVETYMTFMNIYYSLLMGIRSESGMIDIPTVFVIDRIRPVVILVVVHIRWNRSITRIKGS